MPITIGTDLGSHEITALHGKGGMGEVYRARDTKLKREVGIKILPEEFSRDRDRVGRFQREAKVLASLNHRILPASTTCKKPTVIPISYSSWLRAKRSPAASLVERSRLRTH